MTRDELRAAVLTALGDIAPEVDPEEIEPDVNFRDQLDIDSMDFLEYAAAVSKRYGIQVPESDYGELSTLRSAAAYVKRHARA